MVTIAVLITCHNRKDTTLSCLGRLFSIRKDIDVYCVDDNSTDGTADAIRENFPQVNLIRGDGNLFWCRGMRKASTSIYGLMMTSCSMPIVSMRCLNVVESWSIRL